MQRSIVKIVVCVYIIYFSSLFPWYINQRVRLENFADFSESTLQFLYQLIFCCHHDGYLQYQSQKHPTSLWCKLIVSFFTSALKSKLIVTCLGRFSLSTIRLCSVQRTINWCSTFRGRIERKTWCIGPYPIASPYVHSRVVSRLQHIYHGQPYARIDLYPMQESTPTHLPWATLCQSRP